MKRWLVDLNVLLDVLLDRAPFSQAASGLWVAAERQEVELCIAAHAVTTLHYIALRGRGRAFADRCVADVLTVFRVAAVDAIILQRAVAAAGPDFEDAVAAAAAEASGCTAVVTRDPRGFAKANLAVINPTTAVAVLVSTR
jgi:predicted nucleic acid-binding protein